MDILLDLEIIRGATSAHMGHMEEGDVYSGGCKPKVWPKLKNPLFLNHNSISHEFILGEF